MILISTDQYIQIWLGLDFKNERLMLWPEDGLRHYDDGTKAAATMIKSLFEFQRDLYANGRVQVQAADDGSLLGYTDPFLPVNIDIGGTMKNFEAAIAHLSSEIEKRT